VGGLQDGNYKVCFDAGVGGYLSECYDDQEWMNWGNATLVSVVTAQTTTLRDAVLAQAGTIAGSVKNSSGSGIAMVMVTIYDSNNMMIRATQTDWSGNYTLSGLQNGNYKVCFDAMMTGGYPSECYDDQAWMDLAHATPVSVVSGQTATLHDAVLTQAVYYTVSSVAGPGGSISPASQSVLNGMIALFTIIPDPGYEVSSVSGCGGTWSGGNSFSTAPVTFDCTVTAAFSRIVDTVPDAFMFVDQTGVALNTTVVSNAITVAGINAGAPISVTGGQYSVNNGVFTNEAGTVYNGNTVSVRLTSSGSSSTAVNAVLTIGGVSGAFSVTTREAYQFSGFLQPVMNDGSSIFKSGRTVPIKLQLTGAGGVFVTNASATLRVFKVTNDILGTMDVDSSVNASSDTSFRYDPVANQYICNMSSRGLGTGTFVLRVELDDGSAHEARISFR
jgi:hypothetical protein